MEPLPDQAMASLTIKGIPQPLLERLRRSADLHRRSLNGEVIHILERSVASRRVETSETLAQIRKLREGVRLPPLTDELLERAIDDGRP